MNVRPLLDFIRSHEAPKGYGQVWGGIRPAHRPKRPLETMTVQQVLDWQDSIDRLYRSEAAGGYQVLEDTLRDHYRKAGLSPTDVFDAATQDRFAVYLLKRRGLDDYVAGVLTAEDFANRLAREWASLPLVSGPNRGRSYYAGDGLNRSLTTADEFLRVVRAVREKPAAAPETNRPGGFWSAVFSAIGSFFKGVV